MEQKIKQINEESINISTPDEIVSKKLPVFFNEEMALNRTITIILLKTYFQNNTNIRIADILAATGIRTLRLFKEWILKNQIDAKILVNDLNLNFKEKLNELIEKNFNDDEKQIISKTIEISINEANKALLNNKVFDYIEIDPFGSPNPFLDSAIKKIKNGGIIAITATDTAPLCGTYTLTCRRRYDSIPLRNHLMHEIGLRILIRKAQTIGMQYDKALTPLLSLSTQHYMRIFFKVESSKLKCNEILKKHNFIDENAKIINFEKYGKVWTGPIYDQELISNMIKNNEYEDKRVKKLLDTINLEYDCLGFIDLHAIAKKNSLETKSTTKIIESLINQGYIATRTHIKDTAIKTNAEIDVVINIMKKL